MPSRFGTSVAQIQRITTQRSIQGSKAAATHEHRIASASPDCPLCGQPMRLMRDTEETLRGRPCTWWCPDDASVMRSYGQGRWRRMVLTVHGDIVPYPSAPDVRGKESVDR